MAGPSKEGLYFSLFIGVMLMGLCGTCTWGALQGPPDAYGFSALAPFLGGGLVLVGAGMTVAAIVRLRRRG